MYSYEMPKIDITKIAGLTDDEKIIVEKITNSKTGCLRASKPNVKRFETSEIDPHFNNPYYKVWKIEGGEAAYVWRMVAFMVSPIGAHSCMPVMAECDLGGKWDDRKALVTKLNNLVDRIVNSVSINEQHGVKRWARALGY